MREADEFEAEQRREQGRNALGLTTAYEDRKFARKTLLVRRHFFIDLTDNLLLGPGSRASESPSQSNTLDPAGAVRPSSVHCIARPSSLKCNHHHIHSASTLPVIYGYWSIAMLREESKNHLYGSHHGPARHCSNRRARSATPARILDVLDNFRRPTPAVELEAVQAATPCGDRTNPAPAFTLPRAFPCPVTDDPAA